MQPDIEATDCSSLSSWRLSPLVALCSRFWFTVCGAAPEAYSAYDHEPTGVRSWRKADTARGDPALARVNETAQPPRYAHQLVSLIPITGLNSSFTRSASSIV